jgi:Emfourin
VRLRIRRLGGLAGVTLRSHLDTVELDPDEATRVERAVRDLAGHASETGPPHPDAFRYEIAPLDEPSLDRILLEENEVPPELRPLVDSVAASGQVEGSFD